MRVADIQTVRSHSSLLTVMAAGRTASADLCTVHVENAQARLHWYNGHVVLPAVLVCKLHIYPQRSGLGSTRYRCLQTQSCRQCK